MGHLAKPRDASFFRVFFNPYYYGVLTLLFFLGGRKEISFYQKEGFNTNPRGKGDI